MKTFLFVVFLLLLGCTNGVSPTEPPEPKHIYCTVEVNPDAGTWVETCWDRWGRLVVR